MNYPFEFNELLLSDNALDRLGFSEYWDKNGDFGYRQLNLGTEVCAQYRIWEFMDKEDDADGYGSHPIQCSTHHYGDESFSKHLYFLHEMYEDVREKRTQEELDVFLQRCEDANMKPYIDSYLQWLSEQI